MQKYSWSATVAVLTFALVSCNSVSPVPVTSTLQLSPQQVELKPGQQQVFEVKGQDVSDLSWTADGGSVVAKSKTQLLFTAGLNGGTYHLKVGHKNQSGLQNQASIVIQKKTFTLSKPELSRSTVLGANNVCVSPQQDKLLLRSSDFDVYQVFDAHTLQPQAPLVHLAGFACAWLGQDRVLIQDHLGQHVMDLKTNQEIPITFPEGTEQAHASVNQQAQTFVLSNKFWMGEARVFDFSGKWLGSLPDVASATWSPDGQVLVGLRHNMLKEGQLLFFDANLKLIEQVLLPEMDPQHEFVWSADSRHVLVHVRKPMDADQHGILVYTREGELRGQQMSDSLLGMPAMNAANSYFYHSKNALHEYDLLSQTSREISAGGVNLGNKVFALADQSLLEVRSFHLRRLDTKQNVVAHYGLHSHRMAQLFDVIPGRNEYLYANEETLTRMDAQGNLIAGADPMDFAKDEKVLAVSLSHPEPGVFLHTDRASYLINPDFKLQKKFNVGYAATHVQPFRNVYVVSQLKGNAQMFDLTTGTLKATLPDVTLTRVLNNRLYALKTLKDTGCALGELDVTGAFTTLVEADHCQPFDQWYSSKYVVFKKQNDGLLLQIHDLESRQVKAWPMNADFNPVDEQYGVTGPYLMYTNSGVVHFLNLDTGDEQVLEDQNRLKLVTLTQEPKVVALQSRTDLNLYRLP